MTCVLDSEVGAALATMPRAAFEEAPPMGGAFARGFPHDALVERADAVQSRLDDTTKPDFRVTVVHETKDSWRPWFVENATAGGTAAVLNLRAAFDDRPDPAAHSEQGAGAGRRARRRARPGLKRRRDRANGRPERRGQLDRQLRASHPEERPEELARRVIRAIHDASTTT